MPVNEYPRSTDRGPARVKALPIPRNKPVPMVPPRAINWICLDFRLNEVDQHWSLIYINSPLFHLPSCHITILLGGFDVSIQVRRFENTTRLAFNSCRWIDVGGRSMAIVVRRRSDVVLFLLRHNYGGLKPRYLWERLRVKGEILERKSRRGSKGWKGSFIPKRVAVPHKTDSSQGLSLSACHCGKDAFPFSRYTGFRSFLRRLQPSLSEHLNCKAPRGYTSPSLAAEVCVRARCGPVRGT